MPEPRRQRAYDHRLRELVHATGDTSIATDLGVPRSTATGWLRTEPREMVTMSPELLTRAPETIVIPVGSRPGLAGSCQ